MVWRYVVIDDGSDIVSDENKEEAEFNVGGSGNVEVGSEGSGGTVDIGLSGVLITKQRKTVRRKQKRTDPVSLWYILNVLQVVLGLNLNLNVLVTFLELSFVIETPLDRVQEDNHFGLTPLHFRH